MEEHWGTQGQVLVLLDVWPNVFPTRRGLGEAFGKLASADQARGSYHPTHVARSKA